jgi:hypothetical protein
MLTKHTDANLKYPELTKPQLVLTDAESYPEQSWKYRYTRPRTILQLQPLLKAAYPNLVSTYNPADIALRWAEEIEVTQWLIAFAKELGLVHFGRFKTEELANIFRLEFNQPHKRNGHLIKLGWRFDTCVDASNPRLDVVIKNTSVNYFIDQFWSNEIPDKLQAQARKNGLTLESMQHLLNQQEWELKLILGDERAIFDLLVDSIINNQHA